MAQEVFTTESLTLSAMTIRTWLQTIPLIFIAAATPAVAGRLVVVAGGGTGGDGSPAATAKLVAPFGSDFAPDGNIYFVEMVNGERLRTIGAKAIVRTLAGTGAKGSSGG